MPRRPNFPLLAASFLIALCVVAIGYGVSSSVTGTSRLHLPSTIERIDPVPTSGGAGIPGQTTVFVDMQAGYTGVLVVDGLELETVSRSELRDKAKPGQQVVLPPTAIYDDGNATLSFTPSPTAPITSFTQGQHTVQVIYWKVTEDRSHSHSYSWTFSVY
jgi:hypothetical protein